MNEPLQHCSIRSAILAPKGLPKIDIPVWTARCALKMSQPASQLPRWLGLGFCRYWADLIFFYTVVIWVLLPPPTWFLSIMDEHCALHSFPFHSFFLSLSWLCQLNSTGKSSLVLAYTREQQQFTGTRKRRREPTFLDFIVGVRWIFLLFRFWRAKLRAFAPILLFSKKKILKPCPKQQGRAEHSGDNDGSR